MFLDSRLNISERTALTIAVIHASDCINLVVVNISHTGNRTFNGNTVDCNCNILKFFVYCNSSGDSVNNGFTFQANVTAVVNSVCARCKSATCSLDNFCAFGNRASTEHVIVFSSVIVSKECTCALLIRTFDKSRKLTICKFNRACRKNRLSRSKTCNKRSCISVKNLNFVFTVRERCRFQRSVNFAGQRSLQERYVRRNVGVSGVSRIDVTGQLNVREFKNAVNRVRGNKTHCCRLSGGSKVKRNVLQNEFFTVASNSSEDFVIFVDCLSVGSLNFADSAYSVTCAVDFADPSLCVRSVLTFVSHSKRYARQIDRSAEFVVVERLLIKHVLELTGSVYDIRIYRRTRTVGKLFVGNFVRECKGKFFKYYGCGSRTYSFSREIFNFNLVSIFLIFRITNSDRFRRILQFSLKTELKTGCIAQRILCCGLLYPFNCSYVIKQRTTRDSKSSQRKN